jgi:hypothetical protein
MSKQTSSKLAPEVRSRAVRLVLDHEQEHLLLVGKNVRIDHRRRTRNFERYAKTVAAFFRLAMNHHGQATSCKYLTMNRNFSDRLLDP